MTRIFNRLGNEPVAVGVFIIAVIDLLIIFGLDITPEMKVGILAVVDSVAVLTIRQKVTPVAKLEKVDPEAVPPLERDFPV